MIVTPKKSKSPEQVITLITMWLAAAGAVILQFCSLLY
jgi:hypothetical protein